MQGTSCHGILVLDKPSGITSRAAVDRALAWFPRKTKAGHTGTLDPLATGVLVLCLGQATRLTEYVQEMSKRYRAGILLGATSDTDDADGTVTPVSNATPPSLEALKTVLRSFVGRIEQVPPAYSAVKVTGQRAYDLARRGKEVPLSARPVVIHEIRIISYSFPHLELEISCSKGTYIRSLARDVGERLGSGGLIVALRRTQVGPFTVEDAVPLDAAPELARSRLQPTSAAVKDLPRVVLSTDEVRRLQMGQTIPHTSGSRENVLVAVFDAGERLVAVGEVDPSGGSLRPRKVFPDPGFVLGERGALAP